MIVYNVTVNVDESIQVQWLKWMQEKHIPDMIATGKFSKAQLVRVLIEEELGGVTYSIQYLTPNKETLERYYAEDAPALRAEGAALFGDKTVSFRTELEIIAQY